MKKQINFMIARSIVLSFICIVLASLFIYFSAAFDLPLPVAVEIIIIFFLFAIALFYGIPTAVVGFLYKRELGKRMDTYDPVKPSLSDYEGLECKKVFFKNAEGIRLAGYIYGVEGVKGRALTVFAHGIGGGHITYMSAIYALARRGYTVFAYDATGSDGSKGEGPFTVECGVSDLYSAIKYIRREKEFSDMPLTLFGHSWGAFSVCAVLNLYPDVRAVAECSGFSAPSDMIGYFGNRMVKLPKKYLSKLSEIFEFHICKQLASCTGLRGLENSKCKAVIIHSADDTVVPRAYGADIYKRRFEGDERFTFIDYENKGHSTVFASDSAREKVCAFKKALKESGKTDKKEVEAFYRANYNTEEFFEVNEELFDEITDIFDRAIRD